MTWSRLARTLKLLVQYIPALQHRLKQALHAIILGLLNSHGISWRVPWEVPRDPIESTAHPIGATMGNTFYPKGSTMNGSDM